jgi:ADP-heptose:LPS heptosyltransferase
MNTAASRHDAVRPIAVLVDREGLGDTLLKLPFLRAISRAYPDRPIWWIATHTTSMAREMKPFVSDMISHVVEDARITTPMGAVIRQLRTFPPFDLVFDMRTRLGSVFLARTVLKHRGFYCCLPGYALSDRRPPGRWSRPKGIGARALSMAEAALQRPPDWHGRFLLSERIRARAAQTLPDGPGYVGIAIGSREVRKNWPLANYAALAAQLAGRGLIPVFFTGPQERAIAEDLRASIPSALFPQADAGDADAASLEYAIALGERLSVAVANDSGMGHLFGAIGVPLVSLFGPTDPARWAPLTERGVVIRAQDHGGETMEAIPVEAVLAAVERLMA